MVDDTPITTQDVEELYQHAFPHGWRATPVSLLREILLTTSAIRMELGEIRGALYAIQQQIITLIINKEG